MKLYYISTATSDRRWQGTQADAKTAAKDAGGSFEQREVPTDKPGLLRFLNEQENNGQAAQMDTAIEYASATPLDDLQKAELRAVAAATTMSAPPAPTINHTAIMEFILDHASVAQVEAIFAALGTRFKEVTRGQ